MPSKPGFRHFFKGSSEMCGKSFFFVLLMIVYWEEYGCEKSDMRRRAVKVFHLTSPRILILLSHCLLPSSIFLLIPNPPPPTPLQQTTSTPSLPAVSKVTSRVRRLTSSKHPRKDRPQCSRPEQLQERLRLPRVEDKEEIRRMREERKGVRRVRRMGRDFDDGRGKGRGG